MKEQNKAFKELIKSSESLYDLEEKLNDLGLNFNNKKKLAKFLYKNWKKANKDEILALRKEPLEDLCDLPYTEIERNGITYKIHGIVHGGYLFLNLGKRPKKFIGKCIEEYRKPAKSPEFDDLFEEDCLLEPGFKKCLGMKKTAIMEMNETEIDAFKKLNIPEQLKLVGMMLTLPVSLLCSTYNVLLNTTKNNYYYLIKSLQDLRYLKKNKKISDLTRSLPKHLDTEARQENGFFNKFVSYYSLEMARYILRYSNYKKNLKVLHAVVGMGHEQEITYFLKKTNLF